MTNIKNIAVAIVFNLLLAIVGITLITNPTLGVNFVRVYLGLLLIILSVIPFWMFKFREDSTWKEFFKGAILVVLGLFFLISQTGSTIAFGIALAIWMGSSSFLKFAIALEYRKVFEQTWWYMLIFAVITLFFTIFLLFNIQTTLNLLVIIAGVFMVAEATFGLIQSFFFRTKNEV